MGSKTPPSPDESRDDDSPGIAFRRTQAVGARDVTFSWLDTQPARTPVNASTTTLRSAPHDSGPVWFARPSPYETLIHNTSPASAGAHVPVSFSRVRSSVPAQNNPTPHTGFYDHAVVVINGEIYDSSYGERYGSLLAWQQASIYKVIRYYVTQGETTQILSKTDPTCYFSMAPTSEAH